MKFNYLDKTDNRKHKIYGCAASAHLTLDYDAAPEDAHHHVNAAVLDALSALPVTFTTERGTITVAKRTNWHVDYVRDTPWHAPRCYLAVQFKITTSRPSLIPKDADATLATICAALDTADLGVLLLDAVGFGYDAQRADAAAEREARIATNVAKWLAKNVTKKAAEAVRFEQRLAALHAELEAERKFQMKKALEMLNVDIEEHNEATSPEEQISEIAKLAGAKHAERFLAKNDGPFTVNPEPITKKEIAGIEQDESAA